MGQDEIRDTSKKRHRRHRHAMEWRDAFLEALRSTPIIKQACRAAGVSRKVAYDWRKTDGEFAAEWDDALQDGIDTLEEILMRRAQERDTVAMIFLLKGLRPKKYRERYEHSVPQEGPITYKIGSGREKVLAGLAEMNERLAIGARKQ